MAEALEAADRVQAMLAQTPPELDVLLDVLAMERPSCLLTLARGSSDHAASYFAYLAMCRWRLPVASVPPSVLSLYGAAPVGPGALSFTWSQSGQSPDLVRATQQLGAAGVPTVALVNDTRSPLAGVARWALDLGAGPEHSVAATKSFIAQLAWGARLVSQAEGDAAFAAAVRQLPALLRAASAMPWTQLADRLVSAQRMYVIGRGPGMAVAHEMALKLKEVCGIQAEAHSSAEVRHGPMALAQPGLGVLVLATAGPALQDTLQLAAELKSLGADVLTAAPPGQSADLPLALAQADELQPIAAIQSFYLGLPELARARGMDPDRPQHLRKVTRTL